MVGWAKEKLRKIAESDDLHISPFREDGVIYGTPTWIWSVAVDGNLYVCAYYGQNSRWYQAAVRQKAGRITAAGATKEVTFESIEGPINDLIGDAYRAKSSGSPYLSAMIGSAPARRQSRCCAGTTIPDAQARRKTPERGVFFRPSHYPRLCAADNTTTNGANSRI
jgi:hypothetical protein